jgi:acetyltransferase-like isoleucine patch superfamily enzyme
VSTRPFQGKALEQRFRFALLLCSMLFRVIPRPVCEIIWNSSCICGGKIGCAIRYLVLKRMSARCGHRVYIGPNVTIRYWDRLHIGSNCSIHSYTWIDAFGGVEIGNSVSIAHGTSIVSSNHTWTQTDIPIRDNVVTGHAVHISDDIWIGCGCRILAGVQLGSRTVVAAGAVVTRSFPGNAVIGGVPATVIKEPLQ